MKISLLTDDSVPVVDLRKQGADEDARFAVFEDFSAYLNKSLASVTWSHGDLRLELVLARAAITRGERATWVFADRARKGYSTLVRGQSTSYPDPQNAVPADA